jgi:hypothetical protein
VGYLRTTRTRIEFDEPKTLEDIIRKARYCYEQFGHQTEPHKDWKQKNSVGFKKKGFKSPRFKNYRKDSRMSLPTQSVHQRISPPRVEINLLDQPQERPTTQRRNP